MNECLSVFGPNAGKHGPEKTPYLDTFHVVNQSMSGRVFLTKIKLERKYDFFFSRKF